MFPLLAIVVIRQFMFVSRFNCITYNCHCVYEREREREKEREKERKRERETTRSYAGL